MTFGARLKDIMGLGAFSFVNEISSGIVIFVFNKLLLDLGGNIAVAAYGVIANVAIVAIAVFTGITQGSQPLVSRSYGSGSEADVKRVYKLAAIILARLFGISGVFMAYPAAEAAAFVVSMCVKGPLCGKTKCSK